MNPIYSYFKSPWAPSCFSQSVFSQSSNSFPAEDKCLLGPHLNQHNPEDEFLCNGLPSLPSHSSKLFHRLHNANTQKKRDRRIQKELKISLGYTGVPASLRLHSETLSSRRKRKVSSTRSRLWLTAMGGWVGGEGYNAQSQG